MKFSDIYKNSNAFKIILIISFIIIGYISSVLFTQMEKLEDEIEMVSSSNELQYELEKLVSIISIYETSLRSYIITKDKIFLKNKFFSQGQVANTFKQLQILVDKNPARKNDIKALKELIDYRLRLFNEVLILSQTKNVTIEQLRVKLIETNNCTLKMRQLVYKTLRLEIQKSKFHSISHKNKLQYSILLAFLLIILSLLILFLSFNKVNADVNELKKSNEDLKLINDELNAFNNIVSHDLQEPLRKTQMFVSRLEEKEIHLLSQQGKDYFEKIKIASNRMQTLLIDLLNYSRTVKADKIFENTNLNALIQQIQTDLAIDIEEKKASVVVKDLPEILAIPFQIEQLFNNLISNSLKYSKGDVIPKIIISKEKVEKDKKINNKLILEKDYHKIVVSDNGIGFKQEYADQIFLLFKRLETDAKYSGTGIGLSICKRIIDNHNGFIEVKSKPNAGTTFYMYIPKSESKLAHS